MIFVDYIKPLAPYNPFSAEFLYCPRGGLINVFIGATLYVVARCSGAQGLTTGLKGAKNCCVKLAAPKTLFAAIDMDKVGARIAANPAGERRMRRLWPPDGQICPACADPLLAP